MMKPETHAAGTPGSAGACGQGPEGAAAWPRPSLALIALIIGLLTLFADQVAGIVRLSTTRAELTKARIAQEQPLEQARRIESQLDALASGTAQLASEGNPNAAAIVATLQAQGISINPPATPRP